MSNKIYAILATIFLLSFSTQTFSQTQPQTGSVSMQIVDANSFDPVIGAVIELIPADSIKGRRLYDTSNANGFATFNNIKLSKGYIARISFLGYQTQDVRFDLLKEKSSIGVIKMAEETKKIERVEFKVQAMRTSQKGDTVAYNADAFKVTKDADADALLSKMPGIQVTDGTVKAQGEEVKKVLIDGRELFGDDVNAAIKNLPAEAVDKVEVFNKLSDQAQFSGVDDGEGYKAINIVTKPNMRNGIFGKFSASYVFDKKYNVGASVNMFKENRKLSVLAMSNNINQQNFSIDDILGAVGTGGRGRGRGGYQYMVPTQAGVSKVNSVGVNYSNKFSEKLSVTAGYFFNANNNELHKTTDRQYQISIDSLQLYEEQRDNEADNYNHRFNAKIDWNINENNMIMIRPRLTFQKYYSIAEAFGTNDFTSLSSSSTTPLNKFEESSSKDNWGYNFRNLIVYRHKFNDKGRSMMVDASTAFSKNDNDAFSYSYTKYMTPVYDSTINQNNRTNTSSHQLSGSVMYMEPLSKTTFLIANYRVDYKHSESDKRAFMYNPLTGGYDDFNADRSNTYSSDYTTHRMGPGFRHNTEKCNIVGNIYYQYATLDGEQVYPEISTPLTSASFENIVYFGMFNYKFSKQQNLRVVFRSYTDNPSVTQLQDVVDLSNPMFISSGNSSLRPSYSHSVNMFYNLSNVTKGRTFMAMLGAEVEDDYIAQSVTIARKNDVTLDNGVTLQRGAQFTRPVNLDGYRRLRGNVSWGLPIGFIKSNLNFDLGASYSRMPSEIDSKTNLTQTLAYNAGVVLGSNISENFDFTISYNGGYNVAKNNIQKSSDNTYMSQNASLRMKLVTWAGLTFSANGTYTQYHGITDDYNEEYMVINAAIGKKIFRNRRGEISIGINDLLDKNTKFSRNVTDTYIENVRSNVLGRMVMISFTYNLRKFTK